MNVLTFLCCCCCSPVAVPPVSHILAGFLLGIVGIALPWAWPVKLLTSAGRRGAGVD